MSAPITISILVCQSIVWENVTMRYNRIFCAAVLLACGLCSGAEGQSFGRWRVPSTPAQFFGCCHGPGHHAPMIRTPHCQPLYVPRLTMLPAHCSTSCSNLSCNDWESSLCTSGVAPAGCQHGYRGGFDAPGSTYPCTSPPPLFSAPTQPAISSTAEPDVRVPKREPTPESVPTPLVPDAEQLLVPGKP